jgi:hypothetical protein
MIYKSRLSISRNFWQSGEVNERQLGTMEDLERRAGDFVVILGVAIGLFK